MLLQSPHNLSPVREGVGSGVRRGGGAEAPRGGGGGAGAEEKRGGETPLRSPRHPVEDCQSSILS